MKQHEADQLIEQNALVRLTHGSLINWKDLMQLNGELQEMEATLGRARRLAAHLEEVVAMRTLIVQALADRDPDYEPIQQMIALQAWARGQLQEVP